MSISFLTISGCWDERPESAVQLAIRLAGFLTELTDTGPIFAAWEWRTRRHRSAVPLRLTMPPDIDELAAAIDECKGFRPHHGRKTHSKYWVQAGAPDDRQPFFSLTLDSNVLGMPDWHENRADLTILTQSDSRLEQIGVAAAEPALFALIRAWQPRWAIIDTPRNRPPVWRQEKPPRYEGGWVVYLDRVLASRAQFPDFTLVESCGDGHLIRATTSGFDVTNDAHQAAARTIEAAILLLNGT